MSQVDLKIQLVSGASGGSSSQGFGSPTSPARGSGGGRNQTPAVNAHQQAMAGYHQGRGQGQSPAKKNSGTTGPAAAGMGRLIPAVGAVAGAALGAAGALYAMNRAIQAVSGRLADFSPEISRAKAETEAKDIISEVEKAQEFGERFAHWEESWGDFRREFSYGWDYVISYLAEWGAQAIDAVRGIPDLVEDGFGYVLDALAAIGLYSKEAVEEYRKMLKDERDAEKRQAIQDRLNALLYDAMIKGGGPFANKYPGVMPAFAGVRGSGGGAPVPPMPLRP